MARHIVWRRRKHDGRYYPAIEFNYQTPSNEAARALLALPGQQLVMVEIRCVAAAK